MRRPRTPSPTRELGMDRDRNRSSRDQDRLRHRDDMYDDRHDRSKTPVAMDDHYHKSPMDREMTLAEQYAHYQGPGDDRIRQRDSPQRRRRLSPTEYEYDRMQGSRRSRSPSRRDEVHRRSRSEARTEMEYERHKSYITHNARTPIQALDTSSLPNSPIHGGGSPSSTPSTPRKRQLPQVPAVSKSDKGKISALVFSLKSIPSLLEDMILLFLHRGKDYRWIHSGVQLAIPVKIYAPSIGRYDIIIPTQEV